MELLRIKDNSAEKKAVFEGIPNLTCKIADKTLAQLEREGVFVFPEMIGDSEDLTKEQTILQSVNDSYQMCIRDSSFPCDNQCVARISGEFVHGFPAKCIPCAVDYYHH